MISYIYNEKVPEIGFAIASFFASRLNSSSASGVIVWDMT